MYDFKFKLLLRSTFCDLHIDTPISGEFDIFFLFQKNELIDLLLSFFFQTNISCRDLLLAENRGNEELSKYLSAIFYRI